MSHPYYHAVSSARKFGGIPQDYLDLHCLMDSTKMHVSDTRHRLFQHNAWGIFLVERQFGITLVRESDGKIIPVRVLLEQHVIEDFGKIPTLAECFAQLPADTVSEKWDDSWVHAQQNADSYGGLPQDYLPIHQLLNSPRDVMNDIRAQLILHNAWGLQVIERVFEAIAYRASDGIVFSPRQIAQDHILMDTGMVYPLAVSLKKIEIEPWMHRNARRLSEQFGEEGKEDQLTLYRTRFSQAMTEQEAING